MYRQADVAKVARQWLVALAVPSLVGLAWIPGWGESNLVLVVAWVYLMGWYALGRTLDDLVRTADVLEPHWSRAGAWGPTAQVQAAMKMCQRLAIMGCLSWAGIDSLSRMA